MKEPIQLLGTIFLFVRIADLLVKVWFGIVENLAVDVHLGMSFIDRVSVGFSEEKDS